MIKFQADLKCWLDYNFPDTTRDQQIMGVVEELGELFECQILYDSGTGSGQEEKALKDAVGDVVIFLCNYCTKADISLCYSIEKWQNHNFGNTTGAAMINLGRLCHADLKHQQGIRGYDEEKTRQELHKYIAGVYCSLSNYCRTINLHIESCIDVALEAIKKRDWVVNPVTG